MILSYVLFETLGNEDGRIEQKDAEIARILLVSYANN